MPSSLACGSTVGDALSANNLASLVADLTDGPTGVERGGGDRRAKGTAAAWTASSSNSTGILQEFRRWKETIRIASSSMHRHRHWMDDDHLQFTSCVVCAKLPITQSGGGSRVAVAVDARALLATTFTWCVPCPYTEHFGRLAACECAPLGFVSRTMDMGWPDWKEKSERQGGNTMDKVNHNQ
jgi:hypothetical protein